MNGKNKQLAMLKKLIYTGIILIVFTSCNGMLKESDGGLVISIDAKRIPYGGTALVMIESYKPVRAEDLMVTVTVPGEGTKELTPESRDAKSSLFHITVGPDMNSSDGMRIITAVTGHGTRQVVAKASYLAGSVIADYTIMTHFPDMGTKPAMNDYLEQFTGLGGNLVVLHANIGAEAVWGGSTGIKAVWPSKVCIKSASPEHDRIEMMLDITDSLGIPALISVSWDLSNPDLRYENYMQSIEAIIDEQWKMYGHHPSLAGFYSYQEGSGTYLAGYIREFCKSVKKQSRGLLTMCSPNIDDPLLAGYLAMIEDLDIVNYQAPIMTSYRSDNRQMYPNCRVRDITSLSSGATRITDKITLSHVEFMGYHENKTGDSYLTGYDNIFNQFPSAASAYGPDGTSFFSYFSCIFFNQAKLPEETATAVQAIKDGLKAYNLIRETTSTEPSRLAVYIPYADWCIERWQNCITPALDAFRQLGVSYDVLPFVPKKGEEILPFYPMNKNPEQADYLLQNRYVVILPDISGMQETDSEMIEDFVRRGGVVIAFGPRIPYGDRFDREKLWGARESVPVQSSRYYNRITVSKPGARTYKGQSWSFGPIASTAWIPEKENMIAGFPDGTASVFSNEYGEGKTYVVTMSARNAVSICPDLVRDILDDALACRDVYRPFDVYGAAGNMDISMNGGQSSYTISAANYNSRPVDLVIKPLLLEPDKKYKLIDLKSGEVLSEKTGSGYRSIPVRVESNDFSAFGIEPESEQN